MASSQNSLSSSFARQLITALAVISVALLALLPTATSASARVSDSPALNAMRKAAYPSTVSLTNSLIAHWAPVVSDVSARREPNRSAPIVAPITAVTGDGTQNLVLILRQMNVSPTQTWFDVRLATLPNSTGWVPRSALGNIYSVTTHLYVDRKSFTATLKRSGVTIFTTRVGVGKPYWPTPAGEFYIRDKLTNFNNPFYGPLAFGTSARSAVLTDWPGGGFVGVHGTNEPGILPGPVSHGCIRVVNSALLRLGKLMPVGTPLTIT
jgi:lipoprotein-anchoring transpeptidase ErfK/SrfK